MKKFLTLSLFMLIAFQMNVKAQDGITTVHLYDITGAENVKAYGASIEQVNQLMKEIGFPGNYYSFLTIAATDKSENYKYCTIGHWASESVYVAIHEHPKFKAWAETNKKNAVYVKDQLYRKMYPVK